MNNLLKTAKKGLLQRLEKIDFNKKNTTISKTILLRKIRL